MAQHKQTISRVDRLQNSKDGNPRFNVIFTDGTSAPTAPDSAVAYEITNSEHHGVEITVTTNSKGEIIRVEH